MQYRCVKAFGLLEPGDTADLDGDVSPEFFEPVTAPPKTDGDPPKTGDPSKTATAFPPASAVTPKEEA